ncbi:hypothetical protein [Methylocaldum szegediense]|uniref:hypothetical protein n=1 Tax=Methylocaldum szegediense TaxID=73780 RepID=UPI000424EABA|nr:hypothetical protein [Methylocaldum szegediense]
MTENAEKLSPLEKGRKRWEELRAKGEVKRLDPIEKARLDPKSLRKAINGKCWDCIGAGADPNPRGAIANCHITLCTLWPVRPYQHIAGKAETDETDETDN